MSRVLQLLQQIIRPARLLLVEDDEVVGDSLKKLLERHYVCTLVWVRTVREAMRIVHEEQDDFDLVLLNLVLPDGTGAEVCEKLKVKWPTVPVIVITGFAETEVARRVLSMGVVAFFSKPFGVESLENIFRTYKISARTREDQNYFDSVRTFGEGMRTPSASST